MGANVVTATILLEMDVAMDEMELEAGAAELATMLEATDTVGMVTPTELQSCWAKARVAVRGC